MRVWITFEHLIVSPFCVSPLLTHERNARETEFQLRAKLISW